MSKKEITSQLTSRIQQCRNKLLHLLEDWHFLQNIIQPRLLFSYESLFGDLEFELQRKNSIAEDLQNRIEQFSRKVNTNNNGRLNSQGINLRKNSFNHNIAQTQYAEEEQLLNKSQLYRNLVKKLHPDSNCEQTYFERFWDNVQEAYRDNNIHRLRLFHETLCRDEVLSHEDRLEEEKLKAELDRLENNIKAEKQKIDNLKRKEPFSYEKYLNDEKWIANRKKLLLNRLMQVDVKIQRNERLLESISNLPLNKKMQSHFAA